MVLAGLAIIGLSHLELSEVIHGSPPPHADNHETVGEYAAFWLEGLSRSREGQTQPTE